MSRPANQLVARLIGALERGIDRGDARVDDRIARSSSPILDQRKLELCLVTVRRGRGEVGKAAEEIWWSTVHKLDEVRKPLVEVSCAQPEEIRTNTGDECYLGGSDFLGAEIWAPDSEQRRT